MECERVIPGDILDDLCSRFIINVPDEERRDLIRLCFQIESAHWFYLDFYSKNFPTKKPCGIKEFAQQIFKHLPFLQPYANNVEKIIDDWKDYKFCVPTFGAILLDDDLSHVLLVQSYCSRSSWGFPKGKVNKDEPPYQCAIREVYEETGFDISNLINPNEYIEANVNEQVVRLYLIPGINKQEKFEPKTRNEIKAVNWFPICDIPINKKEATLKLGTSANTFFLVSPFLRRLRQWIFDHNQRLPTKYYRRQRHKSCSDIDCIRFKANTLNLKESVAMIKSFKDKRGNFISSVDTAYEVDCIKGEEERSGKVQSFIVGQFTSNESSQFNSTINCSFTKVYSTEQFSLEQPKQKNYISDNNDYSEKLVKSVIDATNKEMVNDIYFDNMIKKKGISAANTSNCDSMQLCNSYNDTVKAPANQKIDILSHESAFRKVEKSTKTKKRNRGKKLLKPIKCEEINTLTGSNEENVQLVNNEFHSTANESKILDHLTDLTTNGDYSVCDDQLSACVPRWVNFKFNINAILKSMEEVTSKK